MMKTATTTVSTEDQPCILPAHTQAVTAHQPEPCEISRITAKQDMSDDGKEEHPVHHETDEDEFNPGFTSRGNSTKQQVNLGQSNGSSGDILVIDPEYPQRQDEHPCWKTVWEMDAGDGGRVVEYETDEEEFQRV